MPCTPPIPLEMMKKPKVGAITESGQALLMALGEPMGVRGRQGRLTRDLHLGDGLVGGIVGEGFVGVIS